MEHSDRFLSASWSEWALNWTLFGAVCPDIP